MKKYCVFLVLWACFMSLNSCKNMEGIYEEFVVPGGLIYTGKPENPMIHSGYNRVKVTWTKSPDPNIITAKIFWNNYADSVIVQIPEEGTEVSLIIENLVEKNYSFFIVTYDNAGHSSIPVEVMGTVYGEKYLSNLLNRPIISSEMNEEGKVLLEWGAADITGGAIDVNFYYYDDNNEKVFIDVDIDETITEFEGDMDKEYFYQTAYLPDSLSIDVLYTNPEMLKIQKIDITPKYLKNYRRPFLREEVWDGSRYGILQDWIPMMPSKTKEDLEGMTI